MFLLKEEYGEQSIEEWLINMMKMHHIQKFGEDCEIIEKDSIDPG